MDGWKSGVDWEDEYATFHIERDVMASAYSVRKLLEAHKLSDSLAQSVVPVEAYPLIGRVPDYMNWHRLDEFYDFSRGQTCRLTITQLCNQFIHSFVWMIESEEPQTDGEVATPGLLGCLVASDMKRDRCVYRVGVDSLIDLFRSVGTEEVVASTMTRDASGKWQISSRADFGPQF